MMSTFLSNLINSLSFWVCIFGVLGYYGIQRRYPTHPTGIIVISGASTGIGRHAAEYLASKGYIVFAGVRKEEDVKSIVNANDLNLRPLLLDVTSHESCVNAAKTVLDALKSERKPMVALVNNAGVSRRVPLELHDIDDAKNVFETNFFGMMDLTQTFLPLLRKDKGRIVMISSISGKIATPTSGIYASSKFAMEAFSDSLRRELMSFDVSVSVVEPGYVRTPIFGKSAEASKNGYKQESEVNMIYKKYTDDAFVARRANDVKSASNATVTTDAIWHAIVSPTPSTRYVVAGAAGLPGWFAVFMDWLLPDRAVDELFFK